MLQVSHKKERLWNNLISNFLSSRSLRKKSAWQSGQSLTMMGPMIHHWIREGAATGSLLHGMGAVMTGTLHPKPLFQTLIFSFFFWGGGGGKGIASKLDMMKLPIGSMYGIVTYIWLKFMVKVGKYTIHGSYGL